jgi:hypothetical protein
MGSGRRRRTVCRAGYESCPSKTLSGLTIYEVCLLYIYVQIGTLIRDRSVLDIWTLTSRDVEIVMVPIVPLYQIRM